MVVLHFPRLAQRILELICVRTLSDNLIVSPHPVDRTKSVDHWTGIIFEVESSLMYTVPIANQKSNIFTFFFGMYVGVCLHNYIT